MYRYMFIYYPAVVFILSGIIARNWDPTRRNMIFTAVLLALACVATVVKFVLMIYRHKTRSVTPDQPTLLESGSRSSVKN